MLSLIIFIPILAALAVLVGAPARKTAFGAAAAQFALTLFAFLSYDKTLGGYQLTSVTSIVPEWKLNYAVGADGRGLRRLTPWETENVSSRRFGGRERDLWALRDRLRADNRVPRRWYCFGRLTYRDLPK